MSSIIGLKEFVSLTMVAIEIGKSHYFGYHSHTCKENKTLFEKRIFYMRTSIDKIELTGEV